jgi:hypothetical protein
MQRLPIIRLGIAASILAHVLAMGVILLSTDVHPFQQAAPELVAVDIVDSDEPAKTPEPVLAPSPTPSPDLTSADRAAVPPSAAPAQPPQPPAGQAAAAQPPAQPPQQPQPQQPRQPQPQPAPAQAQTQGYIPAQPDVTVKYGVLLGLPPALPPPAPSGDKSDDDKDAGPSASANLASNLTAELRRHLRTCLRLPGSVAPSDNVMVKLRVMMTPDGKLAGEPVLIEGTASMKALELKQSAVSALMACQPYAMLPPDRYGEWKVLELSFAPRDFGS